LESGDKRWIVDFSVGAREEFPLRPIVDPMTEK